MVVVGMSGLFVVATACCFPLVLMSQSDQAAYRLYNSAFYISGILSLFIYVVVIARGSRRVISGFAFFGYIVLIIGLLLSDSVKAGVTLMLPLIVGISCGTGLSFASVFWFGVLTLFQERSAMLIQGWQALVGSMIFLAVAFINKQLTSEAAFVFCFLSGVMCFLSLRRLRGFVTDSFPQESIRSDIFHFQKQRVFSRVLIIPLIGFSLISFIFGIAESVAMGYDGSPFGTEASYYGIILGALVFLIWVSFSRNRNYAVAINMIFIFMLAVLWIPVFDAIVLMMSVGYQLGSLLLFALFIDVLSNRRRITMIFVSFGYIAMRGFFLLGLYVPGRFGIYTYSAYFETIPLLMFISYLVFLLVIFILYWELRFERKNKEDVLLQWMETKDKEGKPTQATVDAIIHISQKIGYEYGLTKRETELLGYLARGRDVAFICAELYLSRNTVKGYVKRIYAKLGVHSKQELIDIVELNRDKTSDLL